MLPEFGEQLVSLTGLPIEEGGVRDVSNFEEPDRKVVNDLSTASNEMEAEVRGHV